jgi:hypothetical protein
VVIVVDVVVIVVDVPSVVEVVSALVVVSESLLVSDSFPSGRGPALRQPPRLREVSAAVARRRGRREFMGMKRSFADGGICPDKRLCGEISTFEVRPRARSTAPSGASNKGPPVAWTVPTADASADGLG